MGGVSRIESVMKTKLADNSVKAIMLKLLLIYEKNR